MLGFVLSPFLQHNTTSPLWRKNIIPNSQISTFTIITDENYSNSPNPSRCLPKTSLTSPSVKCVSSPSPGNASTTNLRYPQPHFHLTSPHPLSHCLPYSPHLQFLTHPTPPSLHLTNSSPQVDYYKLGAIAGYTPGSASVTLGKIKRKIAAMATDANGQTATGDKSASGAATTTPKTTPKKRGAGKADRNSNETPTKRAKTPKKGKAAAAAEAAPVKGEEETMDDEDERSAEGVLAGADAFMKHEYHEAYDAEF